MMSLEERLRSKIRSAGAVPALATLKGIIVICPVCGRDAVIERDALGEPAEHRCPRNPAKGCGSTFLVSRNLEGYVVDGERIGLEVWERAC